MMCKGPARGHYSTAIQIVVLIFSLWSLCLGAIPALAAVHTWTGGAADQKWSSPGNWVGNNVPDGDDTIVFDMNSGANTQNCDNDIPGLTGMSITVDDPGDDVSIIGNEIGLAAGTAIDMTVATKRLTIASGAALSGDTVYDISNGNDRFLWFHTKSVKTNGHQLTLTADGNADFFFDADITGSGDVVINCTGAGRTTYYNVPQTYTGATIISAGTLYLNNWGRIGDGSAVSVAAGAVFDMGGRSDEIGSLAGAGNVKPGSGTLTTGGDDTDTVFSGVISGSEASLVKKGAGVFTLSGVNTYQGGTTISGGTLRLGVDGALHDATDVTVEAGAVLDLDGNDETIASLSGAGQVDLGSGNLTFGDANDTTFSGIVGGDLNTGDLNKQGSGKFTLGYAGGDRSRFTLGALNINEGTVQVDSVWVSFGGVNVANGAVLQGNGIIADMVAGVLVNAGGRLAPGGSPGALSCLGPVTFNAGSGFDVELNGATAGNDYDQLITDDAVNLGDAGLNVTVGYTPAHGDAYTIIDNNSGAAVSGVFNGLAEASTFVVGATTFQITYAGGDGNDVVLTAHVAPAAPVAASASGISQYGFIANWNASNNATTYYLDVSENSGFTNFVSGYQNLNVGNATSKAVTGLKQKTIYYYRVRAENLGGASASSNTISASTGLPPQAPAAHSAGNVGESGFTANWGASGGASGYYLDVACDWAFTDFGWGGFTSRYVGNATSYAVSGLRKDWTYLYRVRAVNGFGTSGYSNTISVRTSAGGQGDKPSPPPIPGAQGYSPSPGIDPDKITLHWGASTSVSGEGAHISADTYRVYRAESPVGEKTFLGETASTTFDDVTAEVGRRYYYWVTAVNSAGESGFSDYMVAWRYDKNPGRCGVFGQDGNCGVLWWGCTSNELCLWYLDGADKEGQSPAGATDPQSALIIKAMADFDGDNISDLLWLNTDDYSLELWLLKASSPQSSGPGLEWLVKEKKALQGMGRKSFVIKAGDFNGDKKADILWRDLTNGNVSIWLLDNGEVLAKAAPEWGEGVQCANEGNMVFSPTQPDLPQPYSSLQWEIEGAADFTADGRSELLWRNPSDGRLVTWIMEGAVITGCGYNTTENWEGWEIKGLADLDGDQRADILWRSRKTGGLRAWLMDGSEVKQRMGLSRSEPALSWRIKGLGDFNNDSRADLYWRDQNAGTVRIWLMDGARMIGGGVPGEVGDFE